MQTESLHSLRSRESSILTHRVSPAEDTSRVEVVRSDGLTPWCVAFPCARRHAVNDEAHCSQSVSPSAGTVAFELGHETVRFVADGGEHEWSVRKAPRGEALGERIDLLFQPDGRMSVAFALASLRLPRGLLLRRRARGAGRFRNHRSGSVFWRQGTGSLLPGACSELGVLLGLGDALDRRFSFLSW